MASARGVCCRHEVLQLDPSPFAELAGFERPDAATRLAAMTVAGPDSSKKPSKIGLPLPQDFPAPLVLPHDDLNYDPDWPSQPFAEWLDEPERNRITDERKILYIAAVPAVSKELSFMTDWTVPKQSATTADPPGKKVKLDQPVTLDSSAAEDVISYLKAFYHGLPIKPFATPLKWVPWQPNKSKSRKSPSSSPSYVALSHGASATRIRVRQVPDSPFTHQLNLNDILDAAIEMLPADAYSMLLLVDHDIYEGDGDDFCCGRAYGGSRVAVVQTARYNPVLEKGTVDEGHVWPMSHCKDFVDGICAEEGLRAKAATRKTRELSSGGAIRAAIDTMVLKTGGEEQEAEDLWLRNIVRTVAHELGHCLGMDHCVYYACCMQGTASMAEDYRQPPYLCPVCLTKVSYAVAVELQGGGEKERQVYVKQRYEVLRSLCGRWETIEMFAAWGAWLDKILRAV